MVSFTAEGDLREPTRFVEPILKGMMARQFAAYHRNLRRNVETPSPIGPPTPDAEAELPGRPSRRSPPVLAVLTCLRATS